MGVENEQKKKNVKTKVYQVRLTEEDFDLFESISDETEDSRAEVFRKALRMYATVKRNNMHNSFLG